MSELAVRTAHAPAIRHQPTSLEQWGADLETAAGMARVLAGTAFVPDSLRVWDGDHRLNLDATTAQIAACILTGKELGLDPMAALRSIDIIRGTPALRAATLRALVQQQGHSIWVVEQTDTRAIVRARRAGTSEVMESAWTIDRARKLRIQGFNNPDGNWQRQPANMLVARATAEASRWCASDAILGLAYVAEELADEPDDAGQGAPGVPPARPAPPQRTTRRRTNSTPVPAPGGAPSPAPEHPAAPRPGAGPQPAGPAGTTRGPTGPAEPERAGGEPPPINPAQRARIYSGLRRLGITDRDAMLGQCSEWIGRPISSSSELTTADAATVLTAIGAAEVRAQQEPPDAPEEP